MSDQASDLHREFESLRTTRDELRVQLHLGAAEVRDRWEELERAWQHLESHVKRLAETASEATDDVEQAASLLVDEIKHGYQRIKDVI